jgi:hypothetical protein
MNLSEDDKEIVKEFIDDMLQEYDYKKLACLFEKCLDFCKYKCDCEDKDSVEYYKKYWKETLLESGYKGAEVDEFLNKLLEKISVLPQCTLYEVPVKYDSVTYELVFFETVEKYGTQKVLLDSYFMKFADETGSWNFTSKEVLDKSWSAQEHKQHLDSYKVPDKIPEDADEDMIYCEGVIFDNSETLSEILEKYPVWRIVVGITDFENLF